MKKLFIIACILTLSSFLHSQQFHFFGDSLLKLRPQSIGNIIHQDMYTYLTTSSTDGNSKTQSTVIKVDTSGKTLWTANPANYIFPFLEPVNIAFNQVMLGSDNNMYVWMNTGKVGKMRTSNGSIDWLVPITNNIGSGYLVDYNAQTFLFANTTLSSSVVRLNRFNKSKGQNEGFVDLRCPGQNVFGIYIASNGNIFLASRDSLYKYTSLDNPTFEWRVCTYTGAATGRFGEIDNISLEGNNLLIFGNKEQGFRNGMISCVDITSGTLKWITRNGGSFDVYHADHKIKNGFLYTSWSHLYVGSISERCMISKIDMTTGGKQWEINHAFRTQAVTAYPAEAMSSLVVDDNETVFLAGYALPDNQAGVKLTFMKIRGSNGTVLQKSFIPGSDQISDYPGGITVRLMNGKLYSTGLMPGNASGSRIDTATIAPEKTNLYTSTIQYASSVVGIKNVSLNKKVIVKKVGKWLRTEMVDPYFNRIWEKTIGDTLYPYESMDVLGGNDSAKSVDVPYRKYPNASNNHFYFSQYTNPEFLYITRYDSAGNITHTYTHNESTTNYNPYQFFIDSLKRTWNVIWAGTDIFGAVFPADPTAGISVSGKWTPRPYQLIKPTTYFPYTKDTVIMFREPTGTQFASSLRKSWPTYLPVANTRYYFFPGLNIRWFNSVERESKDEFLVAARDSSMNDLVFKYRLTDSTIVWSKLEDPSYLTIKGYELNGSFYALRTHGTDILLQKYNNANGNTIWTKTIPVPAGHILKLGDFAMSKQRQKITLAGALEDTLIKNMTKLYIITYDTDGNEIHSLTKDGYKAWQNKGMSVTIGQDGQTLVSGQMTDSTYGYAGFIYEVDATSLTVSVPVPQLANIPASVCSNAATQKGKLVNPVAAPYTIAILMDNSITLPFNWTDSTFAYSIANAGTHTIRVTYSYQNSSSFKDSSFVVKATPAAGNASTLAGNVLTAPATGSAYQWYLAASSIPGATSQTYTITQGGTYSYTYTVNGCISPVSASLDAVLTSIVDPTNNNTVISFFPNPTSGNMAIRNLSPSFQYGARIIDKSGKQVYGLVSLQRSNTSNLDLGKLQAGTYILQLWNLSKKVLVGNQQIVIIK